MEKSHPKVVNPRDIAGEHKKKKEKNPKNPSNFKVGTLVAILPVAWWCRVSTGTDELV